MDDTKLTPQLNVSQLKQNIDSLTKQGLPKDQIQSYINNYQKGPSGDYILKGGSQSKTGFFQQIGQGIKQNNEKTPSESIASEGKFQVGKSGLFSGQPILPASLKDTNENKQYGVGNALQVAGKMAVNAVSDLPAVAKGMASILDPLQWGNVAKGIAEYYGGVASGAFNSVKESIKTGNMDAINDALSKAEISMIDHPLQTILAFEGAKGVVEGGAGIAKDPAAAITKAQGVAGKVSDAFKTAKNIATGVSEDPKYMSKTALHNATVQAASNLDDTINAQKKVNELTDQINSFKTKIENEQKSSSEEVRGKKREIQQTQKELTQNSAEYQKAQTDLKIAKNQLDDLNQKKLENANEGAKNTQGELAQSGFSSQVDLQKGIQSFFKSAKDKASEVYDNNLGNAKIDLGSVFKGISKFQEYLRGISDTKTLKAVKPMVDNLIVRDIITKGGTDTEIFKALTNSGVDTKMYYAKGIDELKQEFPPLTSENIKGTRNNLEATIRENNTDALKNFGTNVKDAFKDTFKSAIKDTYGDTVLSKLIEADKSWSEIRSNPLSEKDNPTISDIKNNWESLSRVARQLPEGKSLMEKVQNYMGEQVLNGAEKNGEYDPSKIQTGIKKYGNILGDIVTKKLNGVSDLVKQAQEAVKTTEERFSDIKDSVKDKFKTTESDLKTQGKSQIVELKNLQDKQSKINEDAKSIGSNSADIIKNIKKLDTIDSLNNFLENSGKTIEELRPVVIQSIIENIDKEAGKESGSPFDVNRIKTFISEVNKLGGTGPEGQDVNDELLGDHGKKAFNDLKDKASEYDKLKSIKTKTAAARILQGAFGAILLTVGMGRFFGARQLIKAFSPDVIPEGDVSGRSRPEIKNVNEGILKKAYNITTSNLGKISGGTDKSNQDE